MPLVSCLIIEYHSTECVARVWCMLIGCTRGLVRSVTWIAGSGRIFDAIALPSSVEFTHNLVLGEMFTDLRMSCSLMWKSVPTQPSTRLVSARYLTAVFWTYRYTQYTRQVFSPVCIVWWHDHRDYNCIGFKLSTSWIWVFKSVDGRYNWQKCKAKSGSLWFADAYSRMRALR